MYVIRRMDAFPVYAYIQTTEFIYSLHLILRSDQTQIASFFFFFFKSSFVIIVWCLKEGCEVAGCPCLTVGNYSKGHNLPWSAFKDGMNHKFCVRQADCLCSTNLQRHSVDPSWTWVVLMVYQPTVFLHMSMLMSFCCFLFKIYFK